MLLILCFSHSDPTAHRKQREVKAVFYALLERRLLSIIMSCSQPIQLNLLEAKLTFPEHLYMTSLITKLIMCRKFRIHS